MNRPLVLLSLATVLSLAALMGCFRLRADASLDAMFPTGDPAAEAMNEVLNHFAAADELLVLVTADHSDPAGLLDFAGRFQKAAEGTPEAMSLIDGIIYRGQPDAENFIEHELIPAGLFYLDDDAIAELRRRLTPAEMRKRLAQDYSLISQPGPAAGGLAKALLQDPLGLHELIQPKLAEAKTLQTFGGGDALMSPDGRALLIRVLGKRPPTDLDYAARLTEVFQSVAQQAGPGDLQVKFSGAYAIAQASAKAIRHDSISSVNTSIVLLLCVFAIFYRRPLGLFTLAFAPIAMGIFWGFGAYGLLIGTVSPLAAVIGGILAGMGIDYSVLVLTRYETMRAAGISSADASHQTLRQLAPALLAAWITSIAGFCATGWSSVRALRDFSILGTLGLTGCFLAVVLFLLALMARLDHRKIAKSRLRFSMQPLVNHLTCHRRGLGVFFLVLTAVSLAIILLPQSPLLQPEPNLSVMHPQPNPALDADEEIAARFGIGGSPMFVLIQADSPQKLIVMSHDVHDRLTSIAGVAGTYGLANWLPMRTFHDYFDAKKIIADFDAAVGQSKFNPKSFVPYSTFLHSVLTRRFPPTLASLERYPGLSRQLLPNADSAGNDALVVVFLTDSMENRALRDADIAAIRSALDGLPGLTLTGLDVVSHDAEAAIFDELPRLVWIASGLVAVYLLIHFRSPRAMALSLLPGIIGLVLLAGFVRVAGVHVNTINLVALPLLIGIDVDYGIYLVTLSRQRDNALSSGVHAVCVCASSMIAGYASLMLTSIPAERSLGLVVSVGVIACLGAAIFCLIPRFLCSAPSENSP